MKRWVVCRFETVDNRAPVIQRTGDYQLGGEDVLYDATGDSAITMSDFAVAVVDEAEAAQSLNRRAAVGPPE